MIAIAGPVSSNVQDRIAATDFIACEDLMTIINRRLNRTPWWHAMGQRVPAGVARMLDRRAGQHLRMIRTMRESIDNAPFGVSFE